METEAKPFDLNRREFLNGSSYASLMMLMGGIPIHAEDKPKPDEASLVPDLPAVPVNCALIGCGAWGRELLQTLTRVPGAHVAALCDPYEPALRRVEKAAPKAAKHTDYREVLQKEWSQVG